ncbi:MAG: beta-propeller fold lactonase family protein [Candidatus Solibacter usitatus]|nr:beta-propeller fold lactonase family protein [Candidatus Solibacter usitatus]
MTTVVGSVSDIVLDESRRRLYVINNNANRMEVYSLPPNPIRLVATVNTDQFPLMAAMSRDRNLLYVTAHNSSSLSVIDLNTLRVVRTPSLPARPEGIAIGGDDKVLISTIGTGPGNSQNTLLIYDPNNNGSIDTVVVVPPTPQAPPGAPPAGRAFLANRSVLAPTPDGSLIIGVNIPSNTQRVVFVYEVASGTILRSRIVNNISDVLTIAPDGKTFMSGLTLFDTSTLEVLAQQNLANAPYPIPANTNFNTVQNQGGSIFSPDGGTLYSAFNVAPQQVPAPRPNIGQLMVNDPENLLINMAFQTVENLAGKMVITSDGGTIYAISESGFAQLQVGTAAQNPILDLAQSLTLLQNDQCGVTSDQRRIRLLVNNAGRGRMTVSAQVLQTTPAGAAGLGGVGGPGGGLPGGGVIIPLLPILPGVPGAGGNQGALPGFGGLGGAQNNTAMNQTAPTFRVTNTPEGSVIDLTFNSNNSRTLGTVTPVDLLIQSNEAINIPNRLRVMQNNHNAETGTDIRTLSVGVSANEALEDITYDSVRQRVYIANSGMNRIEVFDAKTKQFMNPIKVGQLPRSMAISPDGTTMYVANTGGENLSVIDLTQGKVTGRLRFPPLPFNATSALVTPSVVAATIRGPLVIMNNGSIWHGVGNDLLPRTSNGIIGTANLAAPRSVAATPNGEYAMVVAGNGFVYLYDNASDDFVQGRQIFTNPIQGYYGPVSAGPNGRYFLVNGTVLNPALTPTGSAGSAEVATGRGVPGGGNQQATTTVPRPVSAVVALNNTSYLRFTQPIRVQQGNATATDLPVIEVADSTTGNIVRQFTAIEGPISTVTGTQRANISGRQMAVDSTGTTAYVISASGLSVIPLDVQPPAERPQFTQQGSLANMANGAAALSPGTLVTINGRNLAASEKSEAPLPSVLGGVCVTMNNRPMPLIQTSPTQITAQVPYELAAGRYPVVVRSIDKKTSSVNTALATLTKYSPAVLVDVESKQAAIYFKDDGSPVTRNNPASRDKRLLMYAIGLGPTKGSTITSGLPTPASPVAKTDPVEVFFGDPRFSQAGIVVESSHLMPGLVGVYELQLYVPGNHLKGDNLDVTVRIGGVSSPTKGPLDPVVAVQ